MAAHQPPSTLRAPDHVKALLQDLHRQSLDQELALHAPGGFYSQLPALTQQDPSKARQATADLMRDKFIALDEDKALFVYQMLRATGALTVVEAGTSFGVSTIYLATAVGQNAADAGKRVGEARAIATEHEASKAAKARENWRAAGDTVEPWIELREGDILQTLREVPAPVEFVLLDIWTPMALPVLKTLEPNLKSGCVIVVDNTVRSAKGYRDYFEYINGNGSSYTTLTLPYKDGLEMTVYRPVDK